MLADTFVQQPLWPRSMYSCCRIVLAISVCFSGSLNADLVILQYHHISDETPAATSTSPELFRQQLKRINELGLKVVNLEKGTTEALVPPESSQQVALTFDDAYESVYTTAWPILEQARLPFTVFVNTDAIERKSAGYMSWEQLRELAQSELVTIGNHTSDHRHLVHCLVNSLTYCELLKALGKALFCRHGGSMSKSSNADPKPSEARPKGGPENLAGGVAPTRCGTTTPSPPRLAIQILRASLSQRINQTVH